MITNHPIKGQQGFQKKFSGVKTVAERMRENPTLSRREANNQYIKQWGKTSDYRLSGREAEARRKYLKKNPDKVKQYKLQSRLSVYGLSPSEFIRLLVKHNYCCAICKKPDSEKLTIDHNHKTNEVRGLLCRGCNTLVGYIETRSHLLETAKKYLEGTDA